MTKELVGSNAQEKVGCRVEGMRETIRHCFHVKTWGWGPHNFASICI